MGLVVGGCCLATATRGPLPLLALPLRFAAMMVLFLPTSVVLPRLPYAMLHKFDSSYSSQTQTIAWFIFIGMVCIFACTFDQCR